MVSIVEALPSMNRVRKIVLHLVLILVLLLLMSAVAIWLGLGPVVHS